jgi:hypothetical protein
LSIQKIVCQSLDPSSLCIPSRSQKDIVIFKIVVDQTIFIVDLTKQLCLLKRRRASPGKSSRPVSANHSERRLISSSFLHLNRAFSSVKWQKIGHSLSQMFRGSSRKSVVDMATATSFTSSRISPTREDIDANDCTLIDTY